MEKVLNKFITDLQNNYPNDQELQKMIETGLRDTLSKTIKKLEDGTYFVITGDIPAMWLRDSAAQIRPFLYLAKDCEKIAEIVKGIIEKQKSQILLDPYANAFNESENNAGHRDDQTEMNGWIWERKYEIDSLCYPVQLAYLYYLNTGDSSCFDDKFLQVLKEIIKVFKTEQDHEQLSNYRFIRTNPGIMSVAERVKYETLSRGGLGTSVKKCGLVWSGFRPSDDACQLGYLIPSNMFIVVVLGYAIDILQNFYKNEKSFLKTIKKLRKEIDKAIKKYGIIKHPEYGKMFAYEVDGFGNFLLMDDANVPSLLSAPYLRYTTKDNPIYLNTRRFLFSEDNPFYFEGKFARGIGSPHTPPHHIWHISLAMEGMTARNYSEMNQILKIFKQTHANTFMMHEGFNVDNPSEFSRAWFSWANSMFIEFVMKLNGIKIKTLK